jgi:DNA-binding transcriptional ArsR family regulator
MGVTKTDLYSETENTIAILAKAFAHPARVAILNHLFKIDTCICGDLVEEIGLAQATISQHLRELKSIDLIQGNIEGTSVCYCINRSKWYETKTLMHAFLNQDQTHKNCC